MRKEKGVCQIAQFWLSTYYVPSARDTDDPCSGSSQSLEGHILFLIAFHLYKRSKASMVMLVASPKKNCISECLL